MSNKTIVSAFTLFASLAAFYYSKATKKEEVPYVMIGGFVGALVGDIISGR